MITTSYQYLPPITPHLLPLSYLMISPFHAAIHSSSLHHTLIYFCEQFFHVPTLRCGNNPQYNPIHSQT